MHRYSKTAREARERTLDLLARVGLPNPPIIYKRYPHQLSGGQQQRAIIAMVLACDPQLARAVSQRPKRGFTAQLAREKTGRTPFAQLRSANVEIQLSMTLVFQEPQPVHAW